MKKSGQLYTKRLIMGPGAVGNKDTRSIIYLYLGVMVMLITKGAFWQYWPSALVASP